MIAATTLLPIAPLLLMPFIIIFFIVVFPIWLVAIMILGAVRGIARLISRTSNATLSIEKAFRWVLSYGGLIELGDKSAAAPAEPPKPTA